MISTLSDALAERGYDQLTDVQQAVTAPELVEADLLVSAQTGSGKTVGFGLAIAPTLMGDEARMGPPAAPLALVVAPTRELAMQVQRELAWLYSKAGARVVSCIGGMDAREERRALDRGAHIVVGTPGRLRDHIMRGALELGDIRAVVLDEADEMLDLGFKEDLEYMLGEAPAERRTLMFSATVSASIAKLAEQYQRDAQRVTTLTGKSQHADIGYQAVQVAQRDTENAIINLLRFHDAQTAIVFANTRAAVARLTARFANRGFSVVSLSGELSQDERSHALQALRDGRARVCVATDVAARGIDLPNLELVIHADLPQNTEALLHRSGRTGRAGRKGTSVLIVPDRASNKASRLLKWAKIQADWIYAPTPEEILAKDEERLLQDEAWTTELTPGESAFAVKLIDTFSAEQIAAACLRLYRGKLSAPEDLNAKPTPGQDRSERPERAEFGPSKWFSLSVGRNDRAEARWLLPLLCRTGNLEKTKIGKIRVQDSETYVEIAEDAAKGLLDQLGPDGVLEDNIRATALDGVPEGATRPAPRFKPGGPRDDRSRDKPRPHRGQGDRPDRPDRPRRDDGAGPYKDRKPRAPREDRGESAVSRPPRPAGDRGPKPDGYKGRSEHGDKPVRKERWDKSRDRQSDGDRPRSKDRDQRRDGDHKGTAPVWGKGKPDRDRSSDRGDKPSYSKGKPGGDKPYGGKPGGSKPYGGKPGGDKPYGGKPGGDKPYGGKPGGKPGGKFGGKPGGKPFGKTDGGSGSAGSSGDGPRKPAQKPWASDPSQRMDRKTPRGGKPTGKPGGKPFGKPGGKPAGKFKGKGGDSAPRRKG